MKKALRILACVGLVCWNTSWANSILGLRYPLGVPARPNSGMSMAMGGCGVSVPGDGNLMLHNPANLGTLRKAAMSSLLLFDFTNIEDAESGEYTNHVRFIPRQVSLGIHLNKAGTIGAAFEKRDDAQLRYEFEPVPYEDDFASYTEYAQSFIRDGGMSSWQIGWGYPIGTYARVGLAYSRLYYRFRESRRLTISGDFPATSLDSTVVDFAGSMIRAGVLVPVWHLTFGLAGEYTLPGEATMDTAHYVNYAPDTITAGARRFDLQLPPYWSAGVSWQIDPRWTAAAEVNGTVWSAYDSEDMLLSAPVRSAALGLSLGGQFIPAPDVLTPAYWETISYRAGFRIQQLPAPSAFEFGIGIGAGFPFPAGGGVVDLDVEYGQRLDNDYPDYREEFLYIGIGINGGRTWKKSPDSTY